MTKLKVQTASAPAVTHQKNHRIHYFFPVLQYKLSLLCPLLCSLQCGYVKIYASLAMFDEKSTFWTGCSSPGTIWNNTCAFLHWQLSITGKLVMDFCCLWTLIKKKKHNDYKITSKESGVTTSVPTSPGTLHKRWWQDANTTYINLPLNTLDVSDVWWDETAVRTCTTATKHEIKVLSGVESLMGFFSCAKSESWVGVSAASNLLFNKPKELSLLLPCLLHKFQTHKQLSVCICPLYDVVKPPLGSWWVNQTTRNKAQHQSSFIKTNILETEDLLNSL